MLLIRAETDVAAEQDHEASRLAARMLIVPDSTDPEAAQSACTTALRQRLERHLSPYAARSRPLDAGHPERPDPSVESLHGYLARRDGPPRLSERLLPRLWPRLWSALKEVESSAQSPSEPARRANPGYVLWEDYSHADRLATRWMDLYRSSFLFTFGFGVLAVFLAVTVYLLKTAGWQTAALVTASVEVVVICAILACFWLAKKGQWHTRGTETRLLAELLRHSIWTWQAGDPVARLPVIEHRPGSGLPPHWVRWYHAALLRALDPGQPTTSDGNREFTEAGLGNLRGRMRKEWFEDQQDYHASAAPRYERVHHRTEKIVTTLFLVVLTAAGLSLGSLLLEDGNILSEPAVKVLLLLVGAVFPAVAAALHGIANQIEAHRLHGTSKRMEHALGELVSRLNEAAPTVSAEHNEQLLHITADASRIMLHEADDWHASLSLHAVHLP